MRAEGLLDSNKISVRDVRGFFNLRSNFRSLISPDERHRYALDAWRFLAMFWIVCQHCALLMGGMSSMAVIQGALHESSFRPIFHAHFGVDIFFVISGYLIGGILIREKRTTQTLQFGRFYLRRALRMLPIYYAVMIVVMLIAARGLFPESYHQSPSWPNFIYINNFITYSRQYFLHAWSLANEEQFYIIFPIVIYFVPLSPRSLLIACGGLVVGVIATHLSILQNTDASLHWTIFRGFDPVRYDRYFDLIYDKPYIRFSSLFLGTMAYVANSTGWAQKLFSSSVRSLATLAFAIGLLSFVFGHMNYSMTSESPGLLFECVYRELFCIGFALLMLATLHERHLQWIFSRPVYYSFFQLSYGIYLVHIAVILRLIDFKFYRDIVNFNAPTAGEFFRLAVVSFFVSGIVALPFYLFVERPFMNLRSRLFGS